MEQVSVFMCDLCFQDYKEVGLIPVPGDEVYFLIYGEEKYHILSGQGHAGDIIYTFKTEPQFGLDEEWASKLDAEDWKMHMCKSYLLTKGIQEVWKGYPPVWLFNECGKLVAKEKENVQATD